MKQLIKGIKNSTLIFSIIFFIALVLTAIFWWNAFLVLQLFSSALALGYFFDTDLGVNNDFPIWIVVTGAGLFLFIFGAIILFLTWIYKHTITKLINYIDNE